MKNDALLYCIALLCGTTALFVAILLLSGSLDSFPLAVTVMLVIFGLVTMLSLLLCLVLVIFSTDFSFKRKRHSSLLDDYDVQNSMYERKHRDLFLRADETVRKNSLFLEPKYTISELVQTLGTNRTDLSMAFKQNTPGGFCRYMNRYRLDHAISLMCDNPDLKVEEVAYQSGFASTNTFGSQFKEYTNGITPRDYLSDLRAARGREKRRLSASADVESPEDSL